ncbi:uncharacterized protein cubi_01539 [Cryptosporidium ubiquitum]|uniref:Uncharacterized protein n=1 Tax=Cryptosporidium ubiquitum TaxID=857276 RepID=A0A1J4MDA8_9CRYT|nr:uncharacterized protein cubi_01539 [Cryptosporidium ubiquitum]OII72206.1 hypothetical protein cubi_01539 [Cryptosporidium ubiquitum]
MLDISYKKVFSIGDHLFPELELRPFLLNLPLNNNDNTRNGIKKKVYRSFSYKIEEYRKELNVFKDENNVFNLIFDNLESLDEGLVRSFSQDLTFSDKDSKIVEDIIELLSDPNICGFIFIIAKPVYEEDLKKPINFKPVLGAVIELVDDNERAIRMIFCKRRLPYVISEKLIRLSIGRIFIHAFKWNYDNGNNKKKNNSKLITILDEHIQFFPIPAYNILIKEMNMLAHWELSSKKISHSDNFKTKCSCHKFSELENSRKFWGISESRYISTIKLNPEIFGSLINLRDFSNCNFFKCLRNDLKQNENDSKMSSSSSSDNDLFSSIHKKRKIV